MNAGGCRGSALLLVILLAAVLAVCTTATMEHLIGAARELAARRDVLCARFAALGALEPALAGADPNAVAAAIDRRVDSLTTRVLRLPSGSCVLQAEARCGSARRAYRGAWPGPCDAREKPGELRRSSAQSAQNVYDKVAEPIS
jgi:hypothetical protein